MLLLLMLEEKEEIEKIVKGDDTMEKAKNVLEELSEDEELVGMYDKEIVDRKVYNTKIKSAENEGLARGLEKGIKEGIEKGIQKGKYEGKKQTVLNMLNDNLDINLISKYTNLDTDEILKIKNNKAL